MALFRSSHATDTETYPVTHTDEEWRAKLSPASSIRCCASTAPSAPAPAR